MEKVDLVKIKEINPEPPKIEVIEFDEVLHPVCSRRKRIVKDGCTREKCNCVVRVEAVPEECDRCALCGTRDRLYMDIPVLGDKTHGFICRIGCSCSDDLTDFGELHNMMSVWEDMQDRNYNNPNNVGCRGCGQYGICRCDSLSIPDDDSSISEES
jgi:hypothetical protein